jgi:hypothetical protein
VTNVNKENDDIYIYKERAVKFYCVWCYCPLKGDVKIHLCIGTGGHILSLV